MSRPPTPHQPLTTITLLLDRADRGKHLTHTEVATIRRCVDEVQTTVVRMGGAPQPSRRVTRAQARVLAELARGGTYAQVAERLFLAESTVLSTLNNARRRVGATTTPHLLAMAIAAGDITVTTPEATP